MQALGALTEPGKIEHVFKWKQGLKLVQKVPLVSCLRLPLKLSHCVRSLDHLIG